MHFLSSHRGKSWPLWRFCGIVVAVGMLFSSLSNGSEIEARQFFETKVLPILQAKCFECHSHAKKIEGGLTLDSKSGWQKGGDSGPAVLPGEPHESLLIQAVRYSDTSLQMPPKGKLTDAEINVLETWVKRGADDPRENSPVTTAAHKSGVDLKAGKKWWSFQPIKKSSPPTVKGADDSLSNIDRFLYAKRASQHLQPAAPADRRTLIRRLKFALLGLPPTPEEVERFVETKETRAFETLVSQYLASPHFGERWARHWMDLVRYSETHGSEHDALYPYAWHYRDYLIRAFNADVPYNDFVREQIAGDLLTKPRWNTRLGINESVIGTASLRLIEFYHTPVDAKREEVSVIESQIDTLGKTYQAMTIACARCHDHKFDPITNDDFYALYGILNSSRAAMHVLQSEETLAQHNAQLAHIKQRMRKALATHWRKTAVDWQAQIIDAAEWLAAHPQPPVSEKPAAENASSEKATPEKKEKLETLLPVEPWRRAFAQIAWEKSSSSLHPLVSLMQTSVASDSASFEKKWNELRKQHVGSDNFATKALTFADFQNGSLYGWTLQSGGGPKQPQPSGGFAVAIAGDRLLDQLRPAGYYTDVFSDRHSGVIRSPSFLLEHDKISVLASGHGGARLRLVVENFQADAVLYATVNPDLKSSGLVWQTLDVRSRWRGMRAHLELLTRDDKPYSPKVRALEKFVETNGRSAWGVAKVVFHHGNTQPEITNSMPHSFWEEDAISGKDVADRMVSLTFQAINDWEACTCDDQQIAWLNTLITARLLDTVRDTSSELKDLLQKYRDLEQQIPIATRAPGMSDDRVGVDTHFMPRGNHQRPGAPVARRFLRVLDSNPAHYAGPASGRLQLAEEIVAPANPLTARVMVNRVWYWLFGQGLVGSVDNFGRLGEQPSHPELLDYLAAEFMEDGWSVKRLIQRILITRTWQQSSDPSPQSMQVDPENRWLQHFSVRRLEAEEIRDAMLAVAGNLKADLFGLPVRVHYKTEIDADKQPAAGPLDGNGRRSIYLEFRRNFPSEFLLAFDQPKATATTGRRSVTNVPAQGLTLLNDPQVLYQSHVWAQRIVIGRKDEDERIRQMVLEAFARPAEDAEIKLLRSLLPTDEKQRSSAQAWQRIAHALLNFKEFIYLQ